MGVSVVSLVSLGANRRSEAPRSGDSKTPGTPQLILYIAPLAVRLENLPVGRRKHVCARGVTTCWVGMAAHVVSRVGRLLGPGPPPPPLLHSMLKIVSPVEIFESIGVWERASLFFFSFSFFFFFPRLSPPVWPRADMYEEVVEMPRGARVSRAATSYYLCC